ncbi:MAG: DUF1456 family protein [Myxococcota bacterium]
MHNNEILRRLTASLSIDEARSVALFALGGIEVDGAGAQAWTGDPKAAGAAILGDAELAAFLDGLIAEQRGPRDPDAPVLAVPEGWRLTNNEILKKLRIALQLQEDGVLRVLAAGGLAMGNRELTTLFRKPGNKHYRKAVDDVLLAFLNGLRSVELAPPTA